MSERMDPRFVWDCYRRLMDMFGNVVLGSESPHPILLAINFVHQSEKKTLGESQRELPCTPRCDAAPDNNYRSRAQAVRRCSAQSQELTIITAVEHKHFEDALHRVKNSTGAINDVDLTADDLKTVVRSDPKPFAQDRES